MKVAAWCSFQAAISFRYWLLKQGERSRSQVVRLLRPKKIDAQNLFWIDPTLCVTGP